MRVASSGAALFAGIGMEPSSDNAQTPSRIQDAPQTQSSALEETELGLLLGGITTPLASMRVHGTSASIEFPDDVRSDDPINRVLRKGWGTIVSGYNTLVWVHFSIPSPLPLEPGKLLLASRVYVFFRTDECTVKHVHLWDGARRFKLFDNVNRRGDFTEFHPGNTWDVNSLINTGLGISVGVAFPSNLDSQPQPFQTPATFVAAGADFSAYVSNLLPHP